MAEKTLTQKLADSARNAKQSTQAAIDWFRNNAKILSTVNANILMARDRERLVASQKLSGSQLVGRMVMFFYDPKYVRDPVILPYYDRFPLVIFIKPYEDGFLGLNLHYLPYHYRAALLDALLNVYNGNELDEKKKLAMSYDILKSTTSYFKPCVKRYLFKGSNRKPAPRDAKREPTTPGRGVTSRFFVVDPTEWDKMIYLPVQAFEGKSASVVWRESLNKLGIRNR